MLWLCDSENWSGSKNGIAIIEDFHYKAMRRILKVPMSKVKEDRMNNSTIREWFGNIEPMSSMWRRRQLFLGIIVILEPSKYPPQLLEATMSGKRYRKTVPHN